MSFCVALTGNIASGKSTVAKIFAHLGIEVISADIISKELTQSNKPAFKKIVGHFSTQALLKNGELNRKYLREQIFNDTQERIWLEQLLHPLIRTEMEHQVKHSKSPYCIAEIPLFINRSAYHFIDRVLLIIASEEVQIHRVMQRDSCSEEQAKAILSSQVSNSIHLSVADDVVENNQDLYELEVKILELHKKYESLANFR